MRDFDTQRAQRDRTFKIGGETFELIPVAPEALLSYTELDDDPKQMLPQMDALILDMIEDSDGAHEKWKALRARKADPLTLGDLQSVMQWMIQFQSNELEEEAGRPTVPPLSSTPGPAATGRRSTGDSSSRATRAA